MKIKPKSKIAIKQITMRSVGLPKHKTTGITNPFAQRILFVTPPGWGKTEWIGSIGDDLIYLACQEGHEFIEAYKVIIDCWDYKPGKEVEPYEDALGNTHMSFMQALDAIEKTERFKMIAVDTVDDLIKMMLDFFYGKHKVDHAEDIGGYGKGWDIAQNTPFRRAFNRLGKSGRGLIFTTHQNVATHQFKKGERSKKETTLPSGIYKLLFAQVGIILHGVFGEKRKPNKHVDRIVHTEGTEDILAKNRGGLMPAQFIVPPKGQWQQFLSFFEDLKNIDKAQKEHDRFYE